MALGITPQEIVDKSEYPLLGKAEHWERVALSDIASVQNGFAFKSSLFDRHEGMPLIRIRDICKTDTEHRYTGEYSQEFVVKSDDILIGMDGDFTASRWKGPNALLNQRVCRLSLLFEDIDEKFFFLCLQPYLNAINVETSSVTVKHLSSKTIGEIPLPLPPLNEQKRIVAKIEELFSELDKGIESLQTAREQLKVYRQAVLKHAFEGKLTEQWRKDNADKLESPEQLLARIQHERNTRYQQQLEDWKIAVKEWEANGKEGKKPGKPKAYNMAVLCSLSEEHYLSGVWSSLRAEDLCDFITKGTTPPKNDLFSGYGDIPFIKVYNLTKNGRLDFSIDPTFVSKQTHDSFLSRSKVYPNDVLMNIVGPPLGKVSIVPSTYDEWNINQAIAIYRSGILLPKFLSEFLLFERTVSYMMSQSKATAGQFNLTLEICRDLPIPVPTIEEQQEIVIKLEEQLTNIDTISADIDIQLSKTETLRQSILKKAFSGQLVSQDPNDEPASELLARIQAEKVALSAKAKKTPAKRARKAKEVSN